MNPAARVGIIAAVWVLWMIPFALNRARGQGKAVKTDPRARLGIFLMMIAFWLAYFHGPKVWAAPVELWRAGLGVVLGIGAVVISWTSVRNLGRQWRFDAGLNEDHVLVTSGAYRFVRHPIYLSMLLMMAMVITLVGTLPGWPFALLFGIAGTEIRVRVEDSLLAARFGSEFTAWQKRVPAYVPFVR